MALLRKRPKAAKGVEAAAQAAAAGELAGCGWCVPSVVYARGEEGAAAVGARVGRDEGWRPLGKASRTVEEAAGVPACAADVVVMSACCHGGFRAADARLL